MSIKAKTDEALVIDKDHAVAADITVDLSDSNDDISLVPITYQNSKYQYCNNGAFVDPATGYAVDGKELTFADVPGASSAGLNYYKEFVVYIAAAGQAIEGAKLNATVTFGAATLTQKAATVDFSVLAVANADITASSQAASHDKTVNAQMTGNDLTIELSDDVDFPLNTTNTSVPVLMRLYIDGALEDGETGKALVRSDSVNLEELTVAVTFTLGE